MLENSLHTYHNMLLLLIIQLNYTMLIIVQIIFHFLQKQYLNIRLQYNLFKQFWKQETPGADKQGPLPDY